MSCSCCLARGVTVSLGGSDITNQIVSVAVDTQNDIDMEPDTTNCVPNGNWIYMYGPTKTAVQITAYPFTCPEEFTLGFDCPVNVNLQVPWKWIFDCRECWPCYTADGSVGGKKRGVWRPIPQRRKQVTEQGARGSSLFSFPDCAMGIAKFEYRAGPQAVLLPQPTNQYVSMSYLGKPYAFNTDTTSTPVKISINATGKCGNVRNFVDVDGYLTSFSFQFTPPNPPQVTYGFDLLGAICPEC